MARVSLLLVVGILFTPQYIAAQVAVGTPARGVYRVDFFNALNLPHYANPSGTLGDANFGRIAAVLPHAGQVIRFGGRFLFSAHSSG